MKEFAAFILFLSMTLPASSQQNFFTNYTVDKRHGHAAEEILKSAAAVHAELIVLGTHGHGIFGRALMGSVATKVISETDTTVMLVQ